MSVGKIMNLSGSSRLASGPTILLGSRFPQYGTYFLYINVSPATVNAAGFVFMSKARLVYPTLDESMSVPPTLVRSQ